MNPELISDLADHRLDPYRDLRKTNATRWSPWFIAEGRMVVRRLLASPFTIRSVLLADSRLKTFGQLIPAGTQVLLVPDSLCRQLVGFDFHAGVMACADRRLAGTEAMDRWPESAIVVGCPDVTLPDNLGSIARLAAGFGAVGLAAGPRAADPWSRRAVRVSMGNMFGLDVFQPDDFGAWIGALRARGFRIVGLEQTPGAIPLRRYRRPQRVALLAGNEAWGLASQWLEQCDETVEVPMQGPVDSLNVATAAAIALYELSSAERGPRKGVAGL